ncbi:MAG: bifunctional NAD(P)H-hydrate repair enzyme [Hyphobacterium sp.]|nr:MAG: bifunctional NAD(P)H-hydrate repair enzyme [Hyphobacterium sp.]
MHPSIRKIISVDSHRASDRFAIANGVTGIALMEKAGEAIARAISDRWARRETLAICGPGNSGGEGFVAARHLADMGWPVTAALCYPPAQFCGDAAIMQGKWQGQSLPVEEVSISDYGLVIDAIFGAGLSRPLDEHLMALADAIAQADIPVVAVDVPTGLHGDLARPINMAIRADLTVTFHQLKPAHCLQPGRGICGETVCADIGIPKNWVTEIAPDAELNEPACWPDIPRSDAPDTHKHEKGRLCVVSGGASATGAARLAAMAGLRAGAGLVTLFSPPSAMQVNATHLTAIMLQRFDGAQGLIDALDARRATATIIGPGCGQGDVTRELVVAAASREAPMILDADALTSFESDPDHLFQHLRTNDVLTPHGGEFARLFPELSAGTGNKIERTRLAAQKAGCTIVFKGADTVIAAPDGRVRVNLHAASALATAGSGDVLAGIIGAFLAQGQAGFNAASAAVWLHGDAGIRLGEGLIAEDIPTIFPAVVSDLWRARRKFAARAALKQGRISA